MSIHPTLRGVNSLKGERSVLTRQERLAQLKKAGKFQEETRSVYGLPKVRTKSVPVPRGMTASSTSLPAPTERRPLAASFTVPSPPTTTTRSAPIPAARSATWAIPPGPSLKSVSPSRPAAAARWAISGQARPVEPFAEAGLTRKTVLNRP